MELPFLKRNAALGPWVLEKELGSGGQGVVWRARHSTELHAAAAAVKICTNTDAKARARFVQEIALLREYAHPLVVGVRDQGEHAGFPYFVMKCASTTLDKVATPETAGLRLLQESPALVVDFFRQACAAVAHLHASGVLHRDIKPRNILLFLDPPEPMHVVLGDLGIGSLDMAQGFLTGTQESIGTPAYRAPEAFIGPHTKASDVYSLGKTLEFLFTRAEPRCIGPAVCLRDARIATPLWDALDVVLRRACAVDPSRRYADAGELMVDLPSTVLTTAAVSLGATTTTTPTSATPSLHADEVRVLRDVIARCTTPISSPGIWGIQQHSRLSDSAFSLGLHRLRLIKFVEVFEADDDRESYSAVRVTDAGLNWALEHRALFEPPSESADASADGDSDIPF